MRVLSFIPAFILAATSFVAAAPAATPATSCVATGGDASAVQPIVAIVNNATAVLQDLGAQLSDLQGAPSAESIHDVVVQISAVVTFTTSQLKGVAVDLTAGVDLTSLAMDIYSLLGVVAKVVATLVALVVAIGVEALGTIQSVILDLFHGVLHLTEALSVYGVGAVATTLASVLAVVEGTVQLAITVVSV